GVLTHFNDNSSFPINFFGTLLWLVSPCCLALGFFQQALYSHKILAHRAMHRIWTAARKEEEFLA
ncbi:MAG: hypothetical protein SW833_08715, partial [Cyanobacteriota bacterium]|nr:hypothetical protein [Cyanobacteriota bacterium]